jgi:hypothetical protein
VWKLRYGCLPVHLAASGSKIIDVMMLIESQQSDPKGQVFLATETAGRAVGGFITLCSAGHTSSFVLAFPASCRTRLSGNVNSNHRGYDSL